MEANQKSFRDYFKLRPIKTAKVSEISEATAASGVPQQDRMNFHIGNPIQDQRLQAQYFKLVTGLDSSDIENISDQSDLSLYNTGWENSQLNQLILLKNAINNSTAYLPRGGYLSNSPGTLITYIKQWLSEGQTEPLNYDFGEQSTQRECMISSGGTWEALRFLFHTLSNYLQTLPVKVFLHQANLPDHLEQFDNLSFIRLNPGEEEFYQELSEGINYDNEKPSFLIMGEILSEKIRRRLREISLEKPLFFIEINQAHNHLSIAREAKNAGSCTPDT